MEDPMSRTQDPNASDGAKIVTPFSNVARPTDITDHFQGQTQGLTAMQVEAMKGHPPVMGDSSMSIGQPTWHPSDPTPGRQRPVDAPAPAAPAARVEANGAVEPDWHPGRQRPAEPVATRGDDGFTEGPATIPGSVPAELPLVDAAAQVLAGDVPEAPDEDPEAAPPVAGMPSLPPSA